MDWFALYHRSVEPPFVPKVSDNKDLSNFEDCEYDDNVQHYCDDGTNWDAEF